MSWFKKSWSWMRWVLLAAAAFFVWRLLRTRISALVDWVSNPASWAKIPGVQTHVVALNPNTGVPEAVELPAGVKTKDVAAVGISEISGGYHVETIHAPRDRRAMLDRDQ
jgi:hypothetical protein